MEQKKYMTKNFKNEYHIKSYIQELQKTPTRIKTTNKSTPRHIIITLQKTKPTHRSLGEAREEGNSKLPIVEQEEE